MFIKDFFSKCVQIRSFLRICWRLLKKFLMEILIFCAVKDLLETMQASAIIVCEVWFSIMKNHKHPSNSKILIKLSSLLMWIMFPKVFYQLIYQNCTLRILQIEIPLTPTFNACHWNKTLALEFRTISPLILRRFESDIRVYSNYAGPKHQGFALRTNLSDLKLKTHYNKKTHETSNCFLTNHFIFMLFEITEIWKEKKPGRW